MSIYPAIDITQSVSRVMNDIVDPEHQAASAKLRRLIALYMENRDLMLMGGYTEGQDPDLDLAIKIWPKIVGLIMQSQNEMADFETSKRALMSVVGG